MNYPRSTLAVAMLLGLSLPGCWPGGAAKHTGLVVVNVLDEPLYNDCRIASSINVSLDEIDLIEGKIEKNAEVIVYCSNTLCTASGFARDRMRTIGFANVRAYEPGTAGWYQAGLPTEGPCQQGYLTMKMGSAESDQSTPDTISTQELAERLGVAPMAPTQAQQ